MYESRLLSFGAAGLKDRLSFLHNEQIRGNNCLTNELPAQAVSRARKRGIHAYKTDC